MSWIKNTLNRYSEKNKSSKIKICLVSRGFHACFIYRISNLMYKKGIPLLPMILTRIIQILYCIDIDFKADIDEGLVIYHGNGIVIGSKVVIGKNVTIFHNVTLGRSFGKNDGTPIIGDGSFIGTGTSILGNVIIGKECKIGANSLVIKSFDDYSNIGGNPAILIKK